MSQSDWMPTSTWQTMQARAGLLQETRAFFASRGFVEVETPLMSADTIVDKHIDPVRVDAEEFGIPANANHPEQYFLQTSPEFAMKRLLAAGSGPVFQICKAFRGGESGPSHNPEFTMLEWYDTRLDYAGGRQQLEEFAISILHSDGVDQITYRDLFQQYAGIDPFECELSALKKLVQERTDVQTGGPAESVDDLLDIILATIIQPALGMTRPAIVYDWPQSQAALAKTRTAEYGTVAERFELYCQGLELANGYCELLDADQLLDRARENNRVRMKMGKPGLPLTSRLVDAMQSGLPACCGVALGIDRLLMVRLRFHDIREVIAFPFDLA